MELNPCRAGLARDPGDYRYSTWGACQLTGVHPFYRNFVHHMRSSLAGMAGAVIETWSGRQVIDEFRRQLMETLAQESKEAAARRLMAQNELFHAAPAAAFTLAAESALSAQPEPSTSPAPQEQHMAEPGRHWIDGGVVGSEKFVRWVASLFASEDEPPPKRLGEFTDGEQSLVTLHQPRLAQTRGKLDARP